MKKKTLIPTYETFIADMETPVSLFKKYVNNDLGFLLESNDNTKGRYSFICKNPTVRLSYKNGKIIRNSEIMATSMKFMDYFKSELDSITIENPDNIPFVGGAYGTVAYDMIREYENIPNNNPDDLNLPDSDMFFIQEGIIYDHLYKKISVVVLDTKENSKLSESRLQEIKRAIFSSDVQIDFPVVIKSNKKAFSNTTKTEYISMVNKAKQYITEGDIFQVVLSQRWTMEQDMEPFEIYRILRSTNPSPYMFYFNFGDYNIAGSSPEMLVELKNNHIKNCPIAGTRKIGKTPEENAIISEELLSDPKERAEHVMLVDLARNDMGRVAEVGSVEVTDFMSVHSYSHVMHIVSLVEGEKNKNETPFSILASFAPAGTLSGAPKIRAMEIIDELENVKRGIYGGTVGYFSFDGNMDTCIAIRTMVIKDKKVFMQAGAGITLNSVPELEYDECLNKVKVLIESLGGHYDSIS